MQPDSLLVRVVQFCGNNWCALIIAVLVVCGVVDALLSWRERRRGQ